jgi:hypothetical protein
MGIASDCDRTLTRKSMTDVLIVSQMARGFFELMVSCSTEFYRNICTA